MSGSHRSFMGAFLKSNKYLTLLGGKKKKSLFCIQKYQSGGDWLARQEGGFCATTPVQRGFVCCHSLGSCWCWRRNPATVTQIRTTNTLLCCSFSSSSTQTDTEQGLSRSALHIVDSVRPQPYLTAV